MTKLHTLLRKLSAALDAGFEEEAALLRSLTSEQRKLLEIYQNQFKTDL